MWNVRPKYPDSNFIVCESCQAVVIELLSSECWWHFLGRKFRNKGQRKRGQRQKQGWQNAHTHTPCQLAGPNLDLQAGQKKHKANAWQQHGTESQLAGLQYHESTHIFPPFSAILSNSKFIPTFGRKNTMHLFASQLALISQMKKWQIFTTASWHKIFNPASRH